MTQKELSYVEDAIGHEGNIIKICNDMVSKLSDQELVSFIKKEVEKHTALKQELMNMLEVKKGE